MTAVLLALMAYEWIGQAAHEWIGIGMFALFVLHHILNGKWSRHLFRGKYTAFRIIQTLLVLLVLLCMIGSMVSGIILSRYALSFLPISGGQTFARNLHMLSAYWGFILMSLHLGLHWNIMLGMVKPLVKKPSFVRTWTVRICGAAIAGYGIYAMIKRGIPDYLVLKNQFVFFDYEEPLVLFFLDYIAVMGSFVWGGHYLSKIVRQIPKRKQAT